MSFSYKSEGGGGGIRIPQPPDGNHFAVCRKVYFLGTHIKKYKGKQVEPYTEIGMCGFLWDLEALIPSTVPEEWLRPLTEDGPAGPCISMSNEQLRELSEKLQKFGGKPYRKKKVFTLYLGGDRAALPPAIESHIGRTPTNMERRDGFDFGLCEGKTVMLKLSSFTPDDKPGTLIQFVKSVSEIQDPNKQVAMGDPLDELPGWVIEQREESLEALREESTPWEGAVQNKPRNADAIRPVSTDEVEADRTRAAEKIRPDDMGCAPEDEWAERNRAFSYDKA